VGALLIKECDMFPIIPIVERIYDHYRPYVEREIQKVTDALEAGAEAISDTVSEAVSQAPDTLAHAGQVVRHGADSLLTLWAKNFKRAGIGRPLTVPDFPAASGMKLLVCSLKEYLIPANFLISPLGTQGLLSCWQTLSYKPQKHAETYHRVPMSFDFGTRVPRSEP
jgi:hypothetical protein